MLQKSARSIEDNENLIRDLLQAIEDIDLRKHYERIIKEPMKIRKMLDHEFESAEIRTADICRSFENALRSTCGRHAVERFQELFLGKYSEWVFFDVSVFAEIYSEEFIEGLTKLLDHNDSHTRRVATKILVEIDRIYMSRWLLKTLNHQDYNVRLYALRALEQIDLNQAIDRWILTLSDPGSLPRPRIGRMLRLEAAQVLQRIGTPKEIAQLWWLCQSGNEESLGIISAIQKRYRFYNYEIEQMALPTNSEGYSITSITNIYGGRFGDFVAGDKRVKIEGDYIEKQENT